MRSTGERDAKEKSGGLKKLSLICFVFAVALFMLGMAFKISYVPPQQPFWPAYLWASLLCTIGSIALYLTAGREERGTDNQPGKKAYE